MQQMVKLGINCVDSERGDNSSNIRDERDFLLDIEQVTAVDQETFDYVTALSREFISTEYR